MKSRLIFILFIAVCAASCKKFCSTQELACPEKIIGSIPVHEECRCTCLPTDRLVYTSPIDGREMCTWHPDDHADEVYIYDHVVIRDNDVAERALAKVSVRFDVIRRPDCVDEYPYQASMNIAFGYINHQRKCGYFGGAPYDFAVYLKNDNRDTLFFDKPIGFYPYDYWFCENTKYFMKGFAVRSEDALDLHFGLYDIFAAEDSVDLYFDVHNGVAIPDTVLHVHMPKIGSKL